MQNDTPIHAALIYGSARAGGLCDTVARWAAGRVTGHGGITLATVDPAVNGPFADGEPAADALQRRLATAEAFILVTPEYNHGYTAALKRLIDSVYLPWQARPVGFVAYGGHSGGLRAVEQLRPVFAELHAMTVRATASIANADRRFDGEGRLIDPTRTCRAMGAMLDELQWWARALRAARHHRPHDQVTA